MPSTITDEEMAVLRKEVPEECELAVAPPGQFNALGNIIACNDTNALVHPELPQDLEDCLKKTLKVRVHRVTLAGQSHIGQHCELTNSYAIVQADVGVHEAAKLEEVLGLPVLHSMRGQENIN